MAVFDAGTDAPDTAAQRSYLVMELITGTTLARRIADGPLEAGEVGDQVHFRPAHVHGQGVVHLTQPPTRPASCRGWPRSEHHRQAQRLRYRQAARRRTDHHLRNHCRDGELPSARQATGGQVGPASDIYLDCWFEALTGAVAYPGHGVAAAAARLHRPPAIPDSLPAGWAALLTAMTCTDPAGRPDAARVAAQLRTLAGRGPLASAPTAVLSTAAQGEDVTPAALSPTRSFRCLSDTAAPATPSTRRRRTMIAIAAAALVGLVALVIALNSGGARQPHTGLGAGSSTPPANRTSSSASTSSTVSTTTTTQPPPAPTTPLQAIAALRAAILGAMNSGTLDPAAAQDLNNRLNDLTQTLAQPSKGHHGPKPQPNPAAQKVADLAHHLSDLAQNGQLSPAGLQQLGGPLAVLERLIPATQ